MRKYMTYEERMDRMMEHGEVEDREDFLAIQRIARREEREELKRLAYQENLGYNGVKPAYVPDPPLDPPE